MHTLAYICSHTYMNYTHVHIHIGHNRYMYIFLPIQKKCNVSLHCTQGGICLGVCMQCICTYIHVCALCVRTLILQQHVLSGVYIHIIQCGMYIHVILEHISSIICIYTPRKGFPRHWLFYVCTHHICTNKHLLSCTHLYT